MQIDFTINTIENVAQILWNKYSAKKIWAFEAAMGAGKTTFIKTLCNHVLKSDDVISSPTFAIINEYKSKVAGNIFHMDWYRLKDEDEAIQAGVEDALHSGNLCLVEWAERAPFLLPDDSLFIRINILDEQERVILIENGKLKMDNV